VMAQNATSSDSNTDSPHATPADTSNSDQQTNQGASAGHSGDRERSNDEERSGEDTSNRRSSNESENGQTNADNDRESGDRGQRTKQRDKSNDQPGQSSERDLNDRANQNSKSWNDRNQANDRSESRRNSQWGEQGRGWQSDIRFGERRQNGLAIVTVEQGTPFYRGGLRQGDVILLYDGRQIRSEDDFGRWASRRSGERIPVIILRDGRRETVYINYQNERGNMDSYSSDDQQSYAAQAFLGVQFKQGIREGAVISSVISGSPAEEAGLEEGDELVSINSREVGSAREASRIVGSMQPGDRIDVEFLRRENKHTQAVLEARPNDSQTAEYGRNRAEVQVFRGGPNYDQMNDSESNQDDLSQENGSDNDNRSTQQYDSNRRGGGLLPRLRN